MQHPSKASLLLQVAGIVVLLMQLGVVVKQERTFFSAQKVSAQGVEICDNGVDDDGDLLRDCEDIGCEGDPACAGAIFEHCDNNVDDDADGAIDCADTQCSSEPPCGGGGGGGNGGGGLGAGVPACGSSGQACDLGCCHGLVCIQNRCTQGIQLLECLPNGVCVIPTEGQGPLGVFYAYVNWLYPWMVGMAAGITLLWALVGGVIIMTSGGDPGKRSDGLQKLQHALLGFLMIAFAAVILHFLNPTFFR